MELIEFLQEECPPVEKNTLIRNHIHRWVQVKKKWIKTAAKNEERYSKSTTILQAIYNKYKTGLFLIKHRFNCFPS